MFMVYLGQGGTPPVKNIDEIKHGTCFDIIPIQSFASSILRQIESFPVLPMLIGYIF